MPTGPLSCDAPMFECGGEERAERAGDGVDAFAHLLERGRVDDRDVRVQSSMPMSVCGASLGMGEGEIGFSGTTVMIVDVSAGRMAHTAVRRSIRRAPDDGELDGRVGVVLEQVLHRDE